MKKIFLVLVGFLITISPSFANEANTLALLPHKGFLKTHKNVCFCPSQSEEIKKFFDLQVSYSNSYNLESLRKMYAENYINADGLSKDVYFDLIKKTWESYPDIKYGIDIKNISINGNSAVVQVHETAYATTSSESGIVKQKGCLKSISDSIYYLENVNDKWQVTSDYIVFEKTTLTYGAANNLNFSLRAPIQITANKTYTTSLELEPPKDTFVIASIGRENITYPQVTAEDVFRKLPDSGILERVFISNSKNLNEYAVASFGITKAEVKNGREIKIYVTGLGFVMLRVNVIPQRESVKVSDNDKIK